jgi:hypothetical protein
MTRKRGFGSIRLMGSGRYQASYWRDGIVSSRFTASSAPLTSKRRRLIMPRPATESVRGPHQT